MIGERRPCVYCNREVEVLSELVHADHTEQFLNCGHSSKQFVRVINEAIGINDLVSASKYVKIEPLITGTIPVQVSGESIPKTQGLLDLSSLNMHNEGKVFVVKPTIYVNSQHTETHIDMSTTTVNNINEVFLLVNNSNRSQEEKSKIKEILSIVDKEKATKPFTEIFSSSLMHLKPWLEIAQPYINLVVGLMSR